MSFLIDTTKQGKTLNLKMIDKPTYSNATFSTFYLAS